MSGDIKTFLKYNWRLHHRQPTYNINDVIEDVKGGKFFGLVECDVSVPEGFRTSPTYREFPPIFKVNPNPNPNLIIIILLYRFFVIERRINPGPSEPYDAGLRGSERRHENGPTIVGQLLLGDQDIAGYSLTGLLSERLEYGSDESISSRTVQT